MIAYVKRLLNHWRWKLRHVWLHPAKGEADGVKASGTVDYSPPVERVCPHCGAKHTGYFQACSACKAALDRGE